MRWKGGRRSTNVEDQRGSRAGPVAIGGVVGLLIMLGLAFMAGADPATLIEMAAGSAGSLSTDGTTGTVTLSARRTSPSPITIPSTGTF